MNHSYTDLTQGENIMTYRQFSILLLLTFLINISEGMQILHN